MNTCHRCETLPELPAEANRLYLWPPLGHTLSKLKAAVSSHATVDDSGKGVLIELLPDAYKDLLARINDALTPGEQADTYCLAYAGEQEPTLQDFGDVTTLRRLVALNEASWLLDVIAEKQLDTHFQPIFKADAPHIPFAHECLLRWRDSKGAINAPQRLFEAAREAELLFQLDRQAREVNIRNSVARGVSSKIFVNFTPTAIYDPRNCLKATMDVIDEVGLTPGDIVFEIVETERVDETAHLKSIMDYYKERGFGVALDDLGSGYSTLGLLGMLRPDYVKLDMELVRDVHQDRFKGELVRRIIELGHKFGIEIIAEGIEVVEEAAWLKSQDVDYFQGFYFARPSAEPLAVLDQRKGT